MLIKGFAQNLAEYMVGLSQKYYSDRWIPHFEFELWREMQGEPDLLDSSELAKLRQLHENCGGWIMMDLRSDELNFLPTAQWKDYNRQNKPF